MNDDFEKITASIAGPMVEFSLHERAPGRWLAALLLGVLGSLLGLVGHIMMVAEVNKDLGGGIGSLALFIPLVALGYGLIHYYSCRKAFGFLGVGVLLGLLSGLLTF